jgi:hypothetical protein
MSLVDESIHVGVIMGIFGKLYTMAKIMQTILLSYGVEVSFASILLVLIYLLRQIILLARCLENRIVVLDQDQ